MRRFAFIGLMVLVLAATSCVLLRTCWARMSPAIASTGGKTLHLRLPDEGRNHLQKDKRWAADQFDASSGMLGSDGCLVTSVATACSNLGVKLTPKELNERLKQADGYLPQGWRTFLSACGATDPKSRTRTAVPYQPCGSLLWMVGMRCARP